MIPATANVPFHNLFSLQFESPAVGEETEAEVVSAMSQTRAPH